MGQNDVFGLGVDIGPNMAKFFAPVPAYIRNKVSGASESSFKRFFFAATLWHMGYGRLPQFGLPLDQGAEHPLTQWENAFWTDPKYPQRKIDKDKAYAAANKLTFSTSLDLGPIAKIPVLGAVVKAAVAPINTVAALAQGQPVAQVMIDNFKAQVGAIKAVGPYVATVISFVPGVGTGVAAAISAGVALAQGKPIDEALEAGIKGAIPGGAIAASGYELAKKIASGENVGKAALEAARAQLPAEAQKAFDIGLAVVSGKQLQQAIAAGIASLAPSEVQQIFSVGAKAIQSTPGLAAVIAPLSDAAKQGAQLAAGALAHTGINETQIRAMRAKLTGDALNGFDTALKAQAQHLPWLSSVVSSSNAATGNPLAELTPDQQKQLVDYANLQKIAALTPDQQKQLVDLAALSKLSPDQQKQLMAYAQASKAPAAAPKPPEPAKPPEPVKVSAAPKPPEPTRSVTPAAPAAATIPAAPASPTAGGAFARLPYPKMATRGAVAGVAGPPLPDACRVWGAPVNLDTQMRHAARSALIASKGRPALARSPMGTFYLFSIENGAITARPCVSR